MSCAYRQTHYRRCVSPADNPSHPSGTWFPPMHPPSITAPQVPIRSHLSEISGSSDSWKWVCELIHSEDEADREQAVMFIGKLIEIHGWHRIPSLPNADIMALWTTLLAGDTQGESRQRTQKVTALLVRQASDDLRRQMWETLRTRLKKRRAGKREIVRAGLKRDIPLWLFPNGRTVLQDVLKSHPSIIGELRNAVRRWIETTRSTTTEGLPWLITDVLMPMPLPSDREYRAWIETVGTILDLYPSLFHTVPGLAAKVFAACSAPDFLLASSALKLVESLRPFGHPNFWQAMNTVRETSPHQFCRRGAAALCMDAACHYSDPTIAHHLIATEGAIIIDHTQHVHRRVEAAEVLHIAMRHHRFAPMVRPYLHTLRNDPTVTEAVITPLTYRIDGPLTDDLIAFADALLGKHHVQMAVTILTNAWGKGYDQMVIDIVHRYSQSNLDPHTQIEILQPGLFSPRYAAQVLEHISAIDPANAVHHLIHGIAKYYVQNTRFQQRPISIPISILPEVARAVLHVPDTVLPYAVEQTLEAMWATDVSIAADVARLLFDRAAPPIRALALGSFRYGWGNGYDAQIADIIARIIRRQGVLNRQRAVTSVTKVVLYGTRRGDPDVIMGLWDCLVQHVPSSRLGTISGFIQSQWHRYRPSMVLAMLRSLYRRCATDPNTQGARAATEHILAVLPRLWGYGFDTEILNFVHTIRMDHVFQRGSCRIPRMYW